MTPEQKAAFINAQTQMMVAEMEGMKAENIERLDKGYSLAYGPEQWETFRQRWDAVLGWNALISFFRD